MMSYCFKNLVFEGGGAKGIAYLGAMEVLEKKDILKNIERIGGASAGAINALLMGLNYSNDELKEKLMDLDFKMFLDDSPGFIRDIRRLKSKFGWYKGDRFYNWIKDRIREKTGNPNSTFKDIYDGKEENKFKDIYFIGANISTGFAEVYSYEDTPLMEVAKAVRISMSIPLFFAALRKNDEDVCVDGGLINNYPVKLFDREKYVQVDRRIPKYYKKYNRELKETNHKNNIWVFNKETLGFRLDSAKEIAVFRNHKEPDHKEIKGFIDYAFCLISTVFNIQSSMHLHSDDWKRTIYIDTLGVSTFDFGLNKENKLKLIESGKNCTEKYFEWYDKLKRLVNKPQIH
jgi:NTE family protein